MRRIRKCFKSGNPQVVLRALDLTDTLMQRCGAHARREVGSEKFLKLVGKLCKVSSWSAIYISLVVVVVLFLRCQMDTISFLDLLQQSEQEQRTFCTQV